MTDAHNLADQLESEAALAVSQPETNQGQTDLLASAAPLLLSRAETKEGRVALVVSAVALEELTIGKNALHRSEERFRLLVEAAPNAMVMGPVESRRLERASSLNFDWMGFSFPWHN